MNICFILSLIKHCIINVTVANYGFNITFIKFYIHVDFMIYLFLFSDQ